MFKLVQSKRSYALGVLTAVYAVSLLDRALIFILLEPIKRDLQLTDSQLGFLSGIAFAIFYATLAIPIARWADRGDRVTIAGLAAAITGGAAASCAWVTTFPHLVVARILTGVGDAGCKPPTYSLLGDLFPDGPARVRAVYIYTAAVPVAGAISFPVGGWLNEEYGWRTAFFSMGLLALAVALLIRLTLTDPRRGMTQENAGDEKTASTSFLSVLRFIWTNKICRNLVIAEILIFAAGHGLGAWESVYLMRRHDVGTSELGAWLGGISVIGGIGGVWLGATVIQRRLGPDSVRQMRFVAIGFSAQLVFATLFLAAPDKLQALSMTLPRMLIATLCGPPILVMFIRIVPDDMRATVLAVMLMFANLIGMGLGPQVVGILSDALTPRWGGDGLRLAMLSVALLYPLAGWCLWCAGRAIRRQETETSPAALVSVRTK